MAQHDTADIVLQGTELEAAVQQALKSVNLCQPSVADKQVGWHR